MASESSEAIVSETSAASTRATLERYINLADYTYTSGLTAFTPKLERKLGVKPLMSHGKIVEKLNNRTGFYGEAFVTTGSAPRQVIIAFEGTNVVTPPTYEFGAAQIADDLTLRDGGRAASFGSSLRFTKVAMAAAAAKGIDASCDSLCGHSLGAADAEFVAAKTGLGGYTFGTPGISTRFTKGRPTELKNYAEHGDPVGNYAADPPDYLGSIVQSADIRHFGATTLVGKRHHSAILKRAARDYARDTALGYAEAAYDLGRAAADYHVLGTYAHDLHLKLYQEDKTKGSDSGFFSFVSGSAGSAKSVANGSDVQELVQRLFDGAFGFGPGFAHQAAAATTTSTQSTLAHLVAGLFGGAHGHG